MPRSEHGPHGVIAIDKPRGPTSFDVVAEVRRRLRTRRVGHTGTLDPMATGVLPICVGEATKLVPFLTDCDKAYEADVVFGAGTTTGDAEGEVNAEADARLLEPDAVSQMATRLVGRIQQRPPMYSAIRVDGKRLYELAREGKEIERARRPVDVHELSVAPLPRVAGEAEHLRRYRLSVRCGKGTYIRVIAEDLGALLGLPAHLSMLRRTAVGRFAIGDACALDALSDVTPLTSLADAISHLPALALDPAGCRRVRAGQERWLLLLPTPPAEGRSRILDEEGALVAVLQRTGQKIVFERVFVDNQASSGAKTPHNNTSAEQGRDA